MARKTKTLKEKLEQIKKEAEQLETDLVVEKENEELILNKTTEEIDKLLESNNIFCGVVLDVDDISKLLVAIINSNGLIKIPYKLYYND